MPLASPSSPQGAPHRPPTGSEEGPSEPFGLSNTAPPRPTSVRKQNSVILPGSGQKVHRLASFLDSGFESLNAESETLFNEDDYQEPVLEGSNRDSTALLSAHTRARQVSETLSAWYHDPVVRSITKCLVAYLIASLGVYWTPFNRFLGTTDSKHVVATVAVYFHPARSKGSMHQTLIYVVVSLLFSFCLSFGCRAASTTFFNAGEDEISYTIDLVVSSAGLGLIAFMKQRVNKETFNTACLLASISVVTCIIKEASLNLAVIPFSRLVSTAQVVVVGSLISVAVCYALWPISAVDELRISLNDSYNIMLLLLSVVTSRFVNGDKLTVLDAEMFKRLARNGAQLRKYLDEAGFELRVRGQEAELVVLSQLVTTTLALSRHLQALRSLTEMQWYLLHENTDSDPSSTRSLHSETLGVSALVENMLNVGLYAAEVQHLQMDYTAANPTQLFALFVYYLAPSVKSYIFTVKSILSEIPFEKSMEEAPHKFIKTAAFQHSLQLALSLFQEKQIRSFDILYSQDVFQLTDFESRTDQEEVTACCGNFSSLLALFGTELVNFLKIIEAHDMATRQRRSWEWLKFWKRQTQLQNESQQPLLNEVLNRHRNWPSTGENEAASRLERFLYDVWKSLKLFRRNDVQFGIRVGLGAFCISFFAFYPGTKEVFNTWRGEWALVIYCIMMNKLLGGTTMTAKWRFIGTFIGAYAAYFTWMATDGNVYALAFVGFAISFPCFHIITTWKKNNPFGRFILLTYNLTALYSYGLRQLDSEDGQEGGDNPFVEEIAVHRVILVCIGVVWAMFVASFFLPNSARARLKTGLTVLWLRLGVIWNSDPLDYEPVQQQDAVLGRLVGLRDVKGINDVLSECETLLGQAPLEFRLKGSFPLHIYQKLLSRTSAIVDAFQNMNLMIEVDTTLTSNEAYVLDYIAAERSEVEQRIFLIFYMILSAMKLGFPLPSKPASTEHAKDRMLFKLSEVRAQAHASLTNEDYVLLYLYILVTNTITRELDAVIDLIKELLGGILEEVFQLV